MLAQSTSDDRQRRVGHRVFVSSCLSAESVAGNKRLKLNRAAIAVL